MFFKHECVVKTLSTTAPYELQKSFIHFNINCWQMYIRNNYNHMIEEGKNPWDLLKKYLLVTKYIYDDIRPEN